MNPVDFTKKYNLHDSLLEKLEISKDNRTVTLTVDFCYWQQNEYTQGEPETGMVKAVFTEVESVVFEPFQINSDEIMRCAAEGRRTEIEVYSDKTKSCHVISITAGNVVMQSVPNGATIPPRP